MRRLGFSACGNWYGFTCARRLNIISLGSRLRPVRRFAPAKTGSATGLCGDGPYLIEALSGSGPRLLTYGQGFIRYWGVAKPSGTAQNLICTAYPAYHPILTPALASDYSYLNNVRLLSHSCLSPALLAVTQARCNIDPDSVCQHVSS